MVGWIVGGRGHQKYGRVLGWPFIGVLFHSKTDKSQNYHGIQGVKASMELAGLQNTYASFQR